MGHTAVGTINQSCTFKGDVITGFLMAFPSLTQKLMFITLDVSIMISQRKKKGYSPGTLTLDTSLFCLNGDGRQGVLLLGQGSTICHNKLESKKVK